VANTLLLTSKICITYATLVGVPLRPICIVVSRTYMLLPVKVVVKTPESLRTAALAVYVLENITDKLTLNPPAYTNIFLQPF